MPPRRSRAAPAPQAASSVSTYCCQGVNLSTGTYVFNVSGATSAGDTLLMEILCNQNGSAVSNVTDSKGNKYTLLGSFTTNTPNRYAYYSPGATGGSGGGPTAALTTSDTITISAASKAMTTNIIAVNVNGAGPIDASTSQGVQGVLSSTLSLTTTQDHDLLVSLSGWQTSGGAGSWTAPFVQSDQQTNNFSFSAAYLLDAGTAGSESCTFNVAVACNVGHSLYAFTQVQGTGAIAAKKAKLAGSGTYTAPVTGTGSFAAKKIKLAGSGTYTFPAFTGTGAFTAKKIKLAGLGTFGSGVVGTATFTAKKIKLAGTGTVSAPAAITGTGSFTAKKIQLAGFGVFPYVPPVVVTTAAPLTDTNLIPVVWGGVNLNIGDRGDGLYAIITDVEGWYGTPPLNGNDLTRLLADGSVWGSKVTAARVVAITGAAIGPRPVLLSYVRELAALAVDDSTSTLAITEDDDTSTPPVLTAEVRADSDALVIAWLGREAITWQLTLTAADPRLYEIGTRSIVLTPAGGGGTGRTYPFTLPRVYAAADIPNQAQLDNPGEVPTPVLIIYTGPLGSSQLTDGTSSIYLQALLAGETVYVRSDTLAANAEGGATRASYVLAGSQPLLVPEGGASWDLYATGSGSVELNWAGAWA